MGFFFKLWFFVCFFQREISVCKGRRKRESEKEIKLGKKREKIKTTRQLGVQTDRQLDS